jgi:DNA-binding beta-propeller fold protein YncE
VSATHDIWARLEVHHENITRRLVAGTNSDCGTPHAAQRWGQFLRISAFAIVIGTIGAPASTVGANPAAAVRAHRSDVLFATAEAGAVLLGMDVDETTSTVIGSTGVAPQSLALAIARDGTTAYTIASAQNVAEAHLAKINLATGAETLVGTHPLETDLYVMGMTFSPDGILYAAGDFDPTSPTFNSLYTIDLETGLATRVGSFDTGATKSAYIMSFTFDPDGNMYGASMMSLYTIDRVTGSATRVTDFVGASTDPSKVMGIAFDGNGKLFAADYIDLPGGGSTIYTVDLQSGLMTPLFKTGIALIHNIAFGPSPDDSTD